MNRTGKIILINGLVLLVGLVVMDFFLAGRLDLYPDFEYVPDMGITANRPNLHRQVQSQRPGKNGFVSFSYLMRTDGDGCRCGEGPPSSSDQVVAVVGDSFTFGQHANYEECLAGRLQRALPDLRVEDFGVCGTCSLDYPPTLQYYWAKKKAARPNSVLAAVVVGLFVDGKLGDLPRVLARQSHGPYKTMYGYPVSPTTYRDLSQSSWQAALFHGEVLMRRYSSLYNRLFPKVSKDEFAIPLGNLTPADSDDLTVKVLANLEALRKAADLPPQRIIVHLIPSGAETLARASATSPVPLDGPHLLWDQISQRARQAGFSVVDPREDFVRRVVAKEGWPFAWDYHFCANGFQWIAEPIAKELSTRVAVPVGH